MEYIINYNKELLIYAFRYSLGRMSFASITTTESIKSHIEKFTKEDLKLFIKEINECQNYGMDFDKAHWMNLSNYLKDKLEDEVDVNIPNNNFNINRDVLIYAFRYGLFGSDLEFTSVANVIESNIEKISKHDIQLFIREIKECQSCGEKYNKEYFSTLIKSLENTLN